MIARRTLVASICASGLAACPATAGIENPILLIERHAGGRIGVFVLDTGSGRMLAHRADERFLMCSTFKAVLAAMVLSRADAGEDDLGAMVRFDKADLVGVSPVTAAHVGKGELPVGKLCSAIVLFSDNAAANLLLKRVGGPAALTGFARGIGDATTRFDRYEPALGERSGDLDTTTPRAIVQTTRKLVLGDALSAPSRARLQGWMVATRTGAHRLRAAFPKDWSAADKTGTGDGLCNDYAVVHPPGRDALVIAAHYDASGVDLDAQEGILRQVGAAIVRWSQRGTSGYDG